MDDRNSDGSAMTDQESGGQKYEHGSVEQGGCVVSRSKLGSYLLTELKHGGHFVVGRGEEAAETIALREDLSPLILKAPEPRTEDVLEFTTPFCYLFQGLQRQWPNKHLPNDNPKTVVANLRKLAEAMIDAQPSEQRPEGEEAPNPKGPPFQPFPPSGPADDSIIPPVYTYWGQFIDHDMTANTDRNPQALARFDITRADLEPIEPDTVIRDLKNLRQPSLNLESVYADGPTLPGGPKTEAAGFYDGVKFRIGRNGENPTEPEPIPPQAHIPPPGDLDRDLPRIGFLLDEGSIKEEDVPSGIRNLPNKRQKAFIGDARNDENLIVAQFHLAFLRFHNAVVDQIAPQAYVDDARLFENARDLTRWHYQWLVVHDFLKTICMPGIPDKILLARPKFYYARYAEPFMPLEFSVAAYRFGHSLVRADYDFNRNFGTGGDGQLQPGGQFQEGNVLNRSSFELLFLFTGGGTQADGTLNPFFGQGERLPFSWIIEWDRFIDKRSSFAFRFGRKIDTRLVPPLHTMVNEGNHATEETIRTLLKRLAARNLLRGYLLSIPTGQAIAEEMDVEPLTPEELRSGNTPELNQALEDGGFIENTPLWFYVLKEAEIRANGNSLGELGSRIVCETIIGLLLNDSTSYLNQPGGWDPSRGVKLPHGELIVTIADFLEFAGVLPISARQDAARSAVV